MNRSFKPIELAGFEHVTKIMASDGCNGNPVPLALGQWYNFHEAGRHLGNVGQGFKGWPMIIDLQRTSQFLATNWYTKPGLVVSLIFTSLSVMGIAATANASAFVSIGLLVPSWLAVYVAWRLSLRAPKTKKNKLGFVISIHCEDDQERRKIREDFIVPLRQLLVAGKSGKDFDFIEFPQHLANQINDLGDAEKLKTKTRAFFMVFGRVRERVLDGNVKHIIELTGIVSHKPIQETTQKIMEKEFSELLPRKVIVSKENDVFSLQFTSEWLGIVAKYIIGMASYLSGNLDYAEQLYRDAHRQLKTQNSSFSIFAMLDERIPIRISELFETRASFAHRSWCETRNPMFIDELGEHLDKVIEERSKEPPILLLKAIHTFAAHRDTERAIQFLNEMKKAATGSADPNVVGSWNYSMAFLYAYSGNLSVAIRHYRNAAMAVVDPNIIDQVESFLCWLLEEEPHKYQLHYCLGFFNWKAKGDVVRADKDFNEFLAARQEGEFEKEKQLANRWKAQMRSKG